MSAGGVTWMHRSALAMALVLGAGHVATCVTGCTPLPPATARGQARSVVKLLTIGVDEGDFACANVADRTSDYDLAVRCAEARGKAKAALKIAGLGVDAYDEGSAGKVDCATRKGYLAALELRDALTKGGGIMPPVLEDGLALFGFYMSGLCPIEVRDGG